MVSSINRGEKLSTFKLTVVQYGILLMMLALAAGLWRLQVLDVENYRVLAEQNRIRKEPILAPRGKLFDRENRLVVDNYLGHLLPGARAKPAMWTPICR